MAQKQLGKFIERLDNDLDREVIFTLEKFY